jgi:hypothetical protein
MAALTGAPVAADELWAAVDTSDSVPLFLEDDLAARAGQTVADAVRKLGPGDKVFLRSFGEAGVSETQLHINIRMAGRTRPPAVARDIEQLFASFPEMLRQGKLKVEYRTNVMGWLERVGPSLNCLEEPTTLLVMTDAIEWSEAIKGSELLQGAPLPPPSGSILEGCHVVFWGVGQQQKKFGNDDRWFPILNSAWSVWMEAAGATSFKAHADYSR